LRGHTFYDWVVGLDMWVRDNRNPATHVVFDVTDDKCKKLSSLKHLVRTTVAASHNENSKYEKGAITELHIAV